MSRSVWKDSFVNRILFEFDFNQIRKDYEEDKIRIIKTDMRNIDIIPLFVGLKFSIYNGIRYNDIIITKSMIGQKLGEFSATKKKALARKKKKQKKR